MKNIAINGFGRIGRLVFRVLQHKEDLNIVAINDITDAKTLAHLLKYDSVHGKLTNKIEAKETSIVFDGKEIKIFAERDPEKLPWTELKVDLVIECTGLFLSQEAASKHLTAGAKKVIISAPSKGDVDATIVMGVNHQLLTKEHKIVSNASCTTNCLAPVMKVMVDNFGVVNSFMTTIHSYTNDQKILDAPHRDLRRARNAATNMIPTTTGAAKATAKVIPSLKGKCDGTSVRVPTQDGSLVDVTVITEKPVTIETINAAMKKAAENELKGILKYTEDPIVSSDVIGESCSSLFDAQSTMVNGNMAKLFSWYDNEWGYSNRVVDLAVYMLSLEQNGCCCK